MPASADELAQVVRLAGAILIGVALLRVMQGDQTSGPFRTALLGTAVLLIGGIALLIATVAPFAARLEEPLPALCLEYLEQTVHGRLLIAPVLPAVYALLVLEMLRSAGTPRLREVLCWMLAAAVFAIGWLFAIGGHASMEEDQRIEMLAQVLHVAAALAWVALVIGLWWPSRQHGSPVQALRRFGNPALVLVMVLVACGLVTAWARNVRIDSLFDDRYGELLVAKSVVLLLALSAAAWNRYVVLQDRRTDLPRARTVLGIEAALLCGVVLLAASLSRTPPPA